MRYSLSINPHHESQRIVRFLKQTFKNQRINRAVIGISGGVDSTVSYYLLKRALPEKDIIGVSLPYFQSTCQVVYRVISIRKIVDMISGTLMIENRKSKVEFEDRGLKIDNQNLSSSFHSRSSNPRLRLGNIMARVRMTILFDLAKQYNALVVGTENRTEHLLGYFTRFGDAASDIEPIQHLYKTQVRELAKYLGVPDKILNQPPTAGLWPGQTDEAEFGFTYEEADQVLNLYHDRGQNFNKIKKMGFANVEKIIDRVKKNSYKHKTPYIVK